jgi:hypothetical protein
MRYSRFRSQIEPSSRTTKKKNIKKGLKGDLKGDLPLPQNLPQQPFPEGGMVPKLEPPETASPFQSNLHQNRYPFVKYEHGTHDMQGPANPQDNTYYPFAQLMSPTPTMSPPQMMQSPPMMPSPSTIPSPQMMPPKYTQPLQPVSHGPQPQHILNGVPFSMTPSLYPGNPTSNPSPFAPYPSFQMPHDFNMDDFTSLTPAFHTGPVIPWEPAPQQQTESVPSPEKIKEEAESGESNGEAVVIKAEEDTVDKICIDLQ